MKSTILFVATGSVARGLSLSAQAANVDLAQAVDAAGTATSINVDVPEGDVLVIPANTKVVLHGRRLLLTAKTVRIDGDARIAQFDETDTPKQPTTVGVAGND